MSNDYEDNGTIELERIIDDETYLVEVKYFDYVPSGSKLDNDDFGHIDFTVVGVRKMDDDGEFEDRPELVEVFADWQKWDEVFLMTDWVHDDQDFIDHLFDGVEG